MEFVRRQVELPEGTLPLYRAERTAKHHRGLVRKKVGVTYDQGEARRIAERSIRKEVSAKNQPADLINIALEGRGGQAGAAGVLHFRQDGLEDPHRGEHVDP